MSEKTRRMALVSLNWAPGAMSMRPWSRRKWVPAMGARRRRNWRSKKVLELSLREALQLGHNYIGTEHMLLGLVREGEGVAAQVLVSLGADLTRVRQQVIQLLSGYQGREGAPT